MNLLNLDDWMTILDVKYLFAVGLEPGLCFYSNYLGFNRFQDTRAQNLRPRIKFTKCKCKKKKTR